jgi:cysteinyl-tRNA synthetase
LTKISELEGKFLQTLNDREGIASAMLIPEEILKHIHKAKEKGETSNTLLNAYERLADMQMKMVNQVTRASKKDRHLLSSLMELLITVRSELREKEKWELADKIRVEMARLGIILEDIKKKTRWKTHGVTQSSPK